MEEAAVHAVDGLSSTPVFILVLGILAILSVVAVRALPAWKEFRTRQLDIEADDRRARLDIERDRELRKMSEAKMRHEHEVEQAAINARMVDAQERSTAAMSALTQQMAVMNGQLEMSKERSAQMGDQIDAMSLQVHEMHGVIVKRKDS